LPKLPRPVPPYEQIASHFRGLIRNGQLADGDRLPSARQLVEEWGVALATAAKVLITLRAEGLVRTVPGGGGGTVVTLPIVQDRPEPIGASAHVSKADLIPGRLVERWTEPTSGGRVRCPLPCHEVQEVVVDPRRGNEAVVICRVCSESYDLELRADSDGGHWAIFTVTLRPFLLSRARLRRYEEQTP
jgi:hypothetical protein